MKVSSEKVARFGKSRYVTCGAICQIALRSLALTDCRRTRIITQCAGTTEDSGLALSGPHFSKRANNATVAAPFFCGTVLSKSVARSRDAQILDSLEPDFVESAVVG
jgi:hypothetical protein